MSALICPQIHVANEGSLSKEAYVNWIKDVCLKINEETKIYSGPILVVFPE